MKRKITSIVLSLALCLSVIPVPAWAVTEETTNYYDPVNQLTASQPCTVVDDTTGTWETGWYVAKGEVTLQSVMVDGSVNLILADGCELTVSDGIAIDENNSLTIWGQTANYGSNGKLIVKRVSKSDDHGASAIGGVHDHKYDRNTFMFTPPTKAGALTVNGGQIEATGGQTTWSIGETDAYGVLICGGDGICVNTFTLNGGSVTAQGAANVRIINQVTNIGGNGIYSVDNIVITGGSVTGIGGNGYGYGGDGISSDANRSPFTISGGTVIAQGGDASGTIYESWTKPGYAGNGLNAHNGATGSKITVSGGTVEATGGKGTFCGYIQEAYGYYGNYGGAGIIGCNYLDISAGTVTATGGDGMGGGDCGVGGTFHNDSPGVNLTVSGSGSIIAKSGNFTFSRTLSSYSPPKIAYGLDCLSLTVKDNGTVEATGGRCDHASGQNSGGIYLATIGLTVTGGSVTATGGSGSGAPASGISTGSFSNIDIKVSGGTVTATGDAYGILDDWNSCAVTVSGGSLTADGGIDGIGYGEASNHANLNKGTVTVTGGNLTAKGGRNGIGKITATNINGGTVIAEGDTVAFYERPTLGAAYSHITTNSDETEVYGWTGGKTEPEETWSKTALKIQPFAEVNGELTVTATPNRVAPGGSSTLKAELTFDLGNDRTLAEDVTKDSTWTLTVSPTSAGTKIETNENCQLIVGDDETAELLTVSAEYIKGSGSYTGSADVAVAVQHTHVWDTWNHNDTHHWYECRGEGDCDITADAGKEGYGEHAWDDGVETVPPTTEATGVKTYTCTVCGATREETIPKQTPEHAHAWADTWTTNDTHHWHECGAKGCGVTADADKDSYGEHAWDDGVETVPPTTEATGVRTYTCTVCGAAREETIPKQTPGHTHAWADTWNHNDTHHWHECGAEGCGVTADADKDSYGEHAWDDGEVTKAPTSTAEGVMTYTCTVCEATKTEKIPVPTYTVSGTVKDSNGNVVADVHVALKQGNKTAASPTKTDADGKYSFENVAPGIYNIVATQIINGGKNKIMTILVTITNKNEEAPTIKMPSDNVNSVLEVPDDGKTPDIVVGGLEAEAESQKENDGTSITTVTMTVVSKEENDAGKVNEITAIKAKATAAVPGTKTTLEYLEIKVEKTVESGGTPMTDTISTTKNMLTIVIPFDFSDKVQDSVKVYRYHGNEVDILTTTANENGERIILGEDSITLYAKNFSVYAIGYTLEGDDTPAGGTGDSTGGDTGNGSSNVTTYSITVSSDATGGTVKATPASAREGQRITITVNLNSGYELDTLTATDSKGNTLALTDRGDGTYTFIMPARNVTVSANFTQIGESYANCPKDHTCPIWPYTDASTTAWYHDGVHYCIENGLMLGYGSKMFGPDHDTSRAMIVVILWRLEGSPAVNDILSFDDVEEGTWYADAVRWATASGVVNGYGNGLFGPNDAITREQMAAMLYRYARYKGYDTSAQTNLSVFTDEGNIDDWALKAMRWANAEEFIVGRTESTLVPGGTTTRAEAATILMRFGTKN